MWVLGDVRGRKCPPRICVPRALMLKDQLNVEAPAKKPPPPPSDLPRRRPSRVRAYGTVDARGSRETNEAEEQEQAAQLKWRQRRIRLLGLLLLPSGLLLAMLASAQSAEHGALPQLWPMVFASSPPSPLTITDMPIQHDVP